jgi:hypothetical protein
MSENEQTRSFLRVGQLGGGRWDASSDEEQPTTIKNERACSFLMVEGWW